MLGDGLSLCFVPSVTTVEVDEEEVEDSLTVESACGWRLLVSSGVLCRVTGGLLCKGLACRVRLEVLERVAAGE